jgi:DUF4097 and DUF4098 domain-containing protein YvlB
MRLVTYIALAMLAVPATPGTISAQVYPERVLVQERVRVVTAAYQRGRRDDNREEQVERTTKTLKLGANGVLALGNIAGDIVVTRGGGNDATVEIVKTARGRDVNEAREMLQLVQVDVVERGGRADVRTRYPDGDRSQRNNRRNFNVSVAYTVTAPAGTRISIESISGSVKIADIKGDVSANTISGDVRITGAGRINAAKTISGMVEIVDAQVDGALESSSVSGDVVMRRVTARRIDAGSVSGNIKLEELQCDRVSANSTSGSVLFSGPLARNGRYELNSFSGEIRLAISGNTGFEIDANSFSGDVRSELNVTTRGGAGRTGRQKVLHGTHGDGSAVLDLTTFSGSIVITKR